MKRPFVLLLRVARRQCPRLGGREYSIEPAPHTIDARPLTAPLRQNEVAQEVECERGVFEYHRHELRRGVVARYRVLKHARAAVLRLDGGERLKRQTEARPEGGNMRVDLHDLSSHCACCCGMIAVARLDCSRFPPSLEAPAPLDAVTPEAGAGVLFTKEVVMRYVAGIAVLVLATTRALAMSVMTNATGPYNYTCEDFAAAKPAQRDLALAFAQGYFAALNMNLEVESQVNLQERWRELNATSCASAPINPTPTSTVGSWATSWTRRSRR